MAAQAELGGGSPLLIPGAAEQFAPGAGEENLLRVTVTGAAGQIGNALLFRLATGEGLNLGPNGRVKLNLLEVPGARGAAEATAMELDDGAFPRVGGVEVFDDPEQAFEGANLGVFVGAIPRGPGVEREQLLPLNGDIFKKQGKAVNNGAAPDFRGVVVGNPAVVNAMIARANAGDVPADRWIAMTMLDHLRGKDMTAKAIGVGVARLAGVTYWGDHGPTGVLDPSQVTIDGSKETVDGTSIFPDVLTPDWTLGTLIPAVRNRGAEVIKAKDGKSSAGSAANAIIENLRALYNGTVSNHWVSMAVSVPEGGVHGVNDEGIMFSFPVRSGDGNFTIVEGLEIPSFVADEMKKSEAALADQRQKAVDLGLMPKN